MHKSTAITWLQQLHDRKSLTPSPQRQGSQENRVCTPLPAQGCLISALHSRATPAAPFQGMLDEYLPPHKNAGLSSPCRWSDLYVQWQLLESCSKTWSNAGFDPPARGDLAPCKKLDEPRQHLLPSFSSEGRCLLVKAAYPNHSEGLSFAVLSHSSSRKEERMEIPGVSKHLLGCNICGRHLPVRVMEHLFILLLGEWGRSGKWGRTSVSLLEQLYRRVYRHCLLVA